MPNHLPNPTAPASALAAAIITRITAHLQQLILKALICELRPRCNGEYSVQKSRSTKSWGDGEKLCRKGCAVLIMAFPWIHVGHCARWCSKVVMTDCIAISHVFRARIYSWLHVGGPLHKQSLTSGLGDSQSFMAMQTEKGWPANHQLRVAP